MGNRYSQIVPTVSATGDLNKPREHVHRPGYFPETEQEALAECTKLLQEMEYRSVRAAKMAYEHSDTYEMLHLAATSLVSLSAGIAGIGVSKYFFEFKFQTLPRKLRFGCLGSLTLTLSSGLGVLFYQEYDKLLPHIEEKHKALNRAGAAWQALELKLRTFRTTSVQKDLSLYEIRERCYQFIEERKEICEIAKPCQWLHNKYVDDYENLLESKKKDSKAIKRYFEVTGENYNGGK